MMYFTIFTCLYQNAVLNCDSFYVFLYLCDASSTNKSNQRCAGLRFVSIIFQECFDPIVDSTIGRDLIPLMVYGYAFIFFPHCYSMAFYCQFLLSLTLFNNLSVRTQRAKIMEECTVQC